MRYLVPDRRSLQEAIQVTLHDLGLSKIHPPRRKFNGAQQIAYTSIVLMGAASLVTGLANLCPCAASSAPRAWGLADQNLLAMHSSPELDPNALAQREAHHDSATAKTSASRNTEFDL
jgi:thiosulfate reductase cytochrome b subunit